MKPITDKALDDRIAYLNTHAQTKAMKRVIRALRELQRTRNSLRAYAERKYGQGGVRAAMNRNDEGDKTLFRSTLPEAK